MRMFRQHGLCECCGAGGLPPLRRLHSQPNACCYLWPTTQVKNFDTQLRKQRIAITPERKCARCGDKFRDPACVHWPNHAVTHVNCSDTAGD